MLGSVLRVVLGKSWTVCGAAHSSFPSKDVPNGSFVQVCVSKSQRTSCFCFCCAESTMRIQSNYCDTVYVLDVEPSKENNNCHQSGRHVAANMFIHQTLPFSSVRVKPTLFQQSLQTIFFKHISPKLSIYPFLWVQNKTVEMQK